MSFWYRAVCFDRPLGPWRRARKEAQEDLLDHGLGERTEWGSFYITVPGDIQTRHFIDAQRAA